MIKHVEVQTKEYRDHTCALFKIMKSIEDEVRGSFHVSFRQKPEVTKCMDFDCNYEKHRGSARFSAER